MAPSTQIIKIICIAAAFITDVSCQKQCPSDKVCIPGPVNAARLVDHTVNATSTCGDPPAEYCRLKPLNKCDLCNKTTHTVEKMTDGNLGTSWQSVTWWEWYINNNFTDEPLKVNVTISFDKSYSITGEIRVTFKSPRPFKMILEKSMDKGMTWSPLQYYADDCNGRFNTPSTPVESITDGDFGLHCVEEYSETTPQENGLVLFDFLRRYAKTDFWNRTLQEYFTATDLRLQMLYPGTDRLENVDNKVENIFNQYFYGISDLRVNARCQCHGHALFCDYPYIPPNIVGKDCDCQHNTEGEDCERCKPLYNNKPWMPATSDSEHNPCEACQCYKHADSCHYNKSLDHGICDDCYHNTTGMFCEQCVLKFYRNMSKPLDDPEVCLPCDCFMFGITNNGTCNQTTGQCECKQNVTGRQCDGCEDTFWGFGLPPVGDCRECKCNGNGTRNGSLSCNQDSGQCPCKDNIHQRTCSECRDGFYSFPKSVEVDCLQCECDYGGSVKEICEKINGTCLCRSHIQGKRCTEVRKGFYVASFYHPKYEAEDAMGSYEATSYFTGIDQVFTGRGYGKIGFNQFISFTVNLPTSFSDYYVVIRYTSIEDANITLRLSISSCNVSACHTTNNFTLSHLPHGAGLAWRSQEAISFLRGQEYHLNLTYVGGMYPNSTIEIDSLGLLPNVRDVRIYEIAQDDGSVHGMTFQQIEDCWNNSTTIAGSQNSSDICRNVTFSAMAEVFDGAIPCSCNSTGTENGTTCQQLGGQCHCKPGVTGQSCDRCKSGFFNFTDSGCTACECSELGSSDLVCDPGTGQCPCRSGVVTRTCSRCDANYYGFHKGQGCVECNCNASGSADLQCDRHGVCPCKNSTTGAKCDMCRENFFNFTSEGCQPCNCHEGGSSALQCHLNTGICTCKANAEGNKCEMCKMGTYNSDPNNPDGCSPCFCFGRSNVCTSAQGFVKSNITADFSEDNYNVDESGNISIKSWNDGDTLEIKFTSNSFINLTLTEKFEGNQLHSYGQLLEITMTYPDVDSLNATWNVNLRNTNRKTASFNIVPQPSLSNTQYHARLHERYTLENITAYELQSILANIATVEISGTFKANGSVKIKVQLVSATKRVGDEVGFVENCTCPNNYTELSCGFCSSGYTRLSPKLYNTPNVFSSCVLCSCTGRSQDCFPENGTCYNCRMGSEGEHCERCQPGVDNTTDCRRCIPGFFGLTPSSGGCRDCECVLPNTLYGNSTVCNETTGQCTCKPRIGGRQCDRCHENAYNTSRGCVDCPECYRLFYVEVKKLRVSSAALADTIDRLRNGYIGDASFAQRLVSSNNTVSSLVSDAEVSQEIEKNVTEQIKQLNETLNRLEEVLMQEVTPGVNELLSNLNTVKDDKESIEQLIGLIRDALNYSNNLLNMSIDPAVREVETVSDYLSKLVQRFNRLSENFTAAAARQNETAYNIQGKVNDAESLIEKANTVAENAVNEQNDLESFLDKLKMRVDVIQAYGEVMNSTAYELFVNASIVLLQANETISQVMLLDPDNSVTVSQIERAAMQASKEAREVISRARNLTQTYSNLTAQVELAVEEVQAMMLRVEKADLTGQKILKEARRARQEAMDAVQLATRTLEDAEEMLQILQNFESKAQEAQEFADLSLQRAKEANTTSLNAIQFAQGINASLQATLATAKRGLDLAQQAKNISFDENQAVSIIHEDANKLSRDADQSKFTAGYFRQVEQNVTAINSSSQGQINVCKGNYSKLASDALRDAHSAKSEADKADVAAKNLQARVDRVVLEAGRLQHVNVTRLNELQSEIRRLRTEFSQKNLANIISELKNATEHQQQFVMEYREKVRQRRVEIAELKQLHASLSSVACDHSS